MPSLEQKTFEARARDWRNGPVIYHVFVDRFTPPRDTAAARRMLAPPQRLRGWDEEPERGTFMPDLGVWTSEIDFWGGDLTGVASKLDYIASLFADAVHLTPIASAFTSHRYDTQDYLAIDPMLGSWQDLQALISAIHKRKMRLVLDGVFNHMGRTSSRFTAACSDPNGEYRDWFLFGTKPGHGYQGWAGVTNLPALRLDNPAVRFHLWEGKDSVVRRYLREGVDGWRLDVAFELGPEILADITRAAHQTRKGSLVVGEITGYPAEWYGCVDGVFNFFAPSVVVAALNGALTGGRAGRMLRDMVADAGIDNLLKSWLHLDNHDTVRVATRIPDTRTRNLAIALQYLLPGCPVIFYGSELGMTGEAFNTNRGPMRWELANDTNPDYLWTRKMGQIRREHPALRYGDYVALESDRLLAFARTTDRALQTVVVLLNPTGRAVQETLAVRVGRLMSWGEMEDRLSGTRVAVKNGLAEMTIPARTVQILIPVADKTHGYTAYDRIP